MISSLGNRGREPSSMALAAVLYLRKPKDLLLIRKFVRRMKDSKCQRVSGLIFEKAANLGPYLRKLCVLNAENKKNNSHDVCKRSSSSNNYRT